MKKELEMCQIGYILLKFNDIWPIIIENERPSYVKNIWKIGN